MLIKAKIKPSYIAYYVYIILSMFVAGIVLFSGLEWLWAVLLSLSVLLLSTLKFVYFSNVAVRLIWLEQQTEDHWLLTLIPKLPKKIANQEKAHSITINALFIRIQRNLFWFSLTFDISHPLIKTSTFVIYKDQVDENTWRRLSVLTRLKSAL